MMATLEREDTTLVDEQDAQEKSGFAKLDPVPLELLFQGQKPTYTDSDELLRTLPDINDELAGRQHSEEDSAPSEENVVAVQQVEQQQQRDGEEVELVDEVDISVQPIDRESAFRTLKMDPKTSSKTNLYPDISSVPSLTERQAKRVSQVQVILPTNEDEQEQQFEENVLEDELLSGRTVYLTEVLKNENLIEHILHDIAICPPYHNKHLQRFMQLHESTESGVDVLEHVHGEEGGEDSRFVYLVRKYRESEIAYDEAVSLVERTVNECRLKQNAVWVKRNGVVEQTQPLKRSNGTSAEGGGNNDAGTIQATVSFQVAQFSRKTVKQLEMELKQFAEYRSHNVTEKGFELSMARFAVEQCIYQWMAKSSLFCPRIDESSEAMENRDRIVKRVRFFFSVLLAFEKKCAEEIHAGPTATKRGRKSFQKSVRNWIRHVASGLLQCGRPEERAFLLKHLAHYQQIGTAQDGEWLLPFFQPGPLDNSFNRFNQDLNDVWTEEDVEVFLGVVHLLLINIQDGILEEGDFVTLLSQCPFQVAIENLFPSPGQVSDINLDEVRSLFSRAFYLVNMLFETGSRLKWYPQVSKILTQHGSAILVRTGKLVQDLKSYGDTVVWGAAQMLFDRLSLFGIQYIVNSSDQNLRLIFDSIPFNMISSEALWRLFVALIVDYRGQDISDLQSIFGSFQGEQDKPSFILKSRSSRSVVLENEDDQDMTDTLFHKYQYVCGLQNWSDVVHKDPRIRDKFMEKFLPKKLQHEESSNNTVTSTSQTFSKQNVSDTSPKNEAMYRVLALSSVASVCGGGLASAIVGEILYAAFCGHEDSILRTDTDLIRSTCELLGGICNEYPWLISQILHTVSLHLQSFCNENHPEDMCKSPGLFVFKNLPLRSWVPKLDQDIKQILRPWLLSGNTCKCTLAMLIVEELNWEEADFLPPIIHQEMAIIIFEAYRKRNKLVMDADQLLGTRQASQEQQLQQQQHSRLGASPFTQLRRWIPLTQEYQFERQVEAFNKWSWQTLLCMRFHNLQTFRHFVQVYDFGNVHDTSSGGVLRHSWKDDCQAYLDSKKISEKQQQSGTRAGEGGVAAIDVAYLDPLLAYLLLQVTNYGQIMDDWLPLKVLVHHLTQSNDCATYFESALLKVLFCLIPTYAKEQNSDNRQYRTLPAPDAWLFPLLGTLPHRERSVLSEMLSRVLPASPVPNSGSGGIGFATSEDGGGDIRERNAAPKSSQVIKTPTTSPTRRRERAGSRNSSPATSPKRRGSKPSTDGSSSTSSASNSTSYVDYLGSLIQSQLILASDLRDGEMVKGLIVFWFTNITKYGEWASFPRCRDLVDGIIKICYCIHDRMRSYDVVAVGEIDMLLSSQLHEMAERGVAQQAKKQTIPHHLSILPIQSSFFSKVDVASVITNCDWLSFQALLVETGHEYPLWIAIGHVLCDPARKNAEIDSVKSSLGDLLATHGMTNGVIYQFLHTDPKRLSEYRIYRWANYALHVPADHPLLILFWQMLLTLVFSKSGSEFFGYKFLRRSKRSSRRSNLRELLVERAKELTVHFYEIDRQQRSFKPETSGNEGVHGHANSHAVMLGEVFNAFGLWLREANPAEWLNESQISSLGQEYCLPRLIAVLNSPLLQTLHRATTESINKGGNVDLVGVRRHLWLDLANLSSSDLMVKVRWQTKQWIFPDTKKKFQNERAAQQRGTLAFLRGGSSTSTSSLSSSSSSLLQHDFGKAHHHHPRIRSRSRSMSMDNSQDGDSTPLRYPAIYLFREPQVPEVVDIEAIDVLDCLEILQGESVAYDGKVERFYADLAMLMQNLPQLYRKRTRLEKIEKVGKDKETYKFQIEVEESVLDEFVQQKMTEIWIKCEAELFGWEVHKSNTTRSKTYREQEENDDESLLFRSSPKHGNQRTASRIKSQLEKESQMRIKIATINNVVDQLCDLWDLDKEGSLDAEKSITVSKIGTNWFRQLLNAETSITRGYSPAQRVLWSSIAKLGIRFAKGSLDETRLTLRCMLQDSNRIPLLAPFFEPSLFIERLLNFYAAVWEELPKLPPEDALAVLSKFDFRAWLSLHPTFDLRSRLMLMVGGVLRQTSWKQVIEKDDNNSVVKIFDFHRDIVNMLCLADMNHHFNQALCILLGSEIAVDGQKSSTPKNMDAKNKGLLSLTTVDDGPVLVGVIAHPKVWDSVLSIDDNHWKELSFPVLLDVCRIVGQSLFRLRSNGSGSIHTLYTEPGCLVQQWNGLGLIECFLELAMKLIRLSLDKTETAFGNTTVMDEVDLMKHREGIKDIWGAILSLFEPWLVSVYHTKQNGMNESHEFITKTYIVSPDETVEAPWPNELASLAKTIVQGFVKCVSHLEAFLHRGRQDLVGWLYDSLFWLYFHRLLPCAPPHVLTLIQTELCTMTWNHWTISEPCLEQMSATVTSSVSAKPHNLPNLLFVQGLLAKLNWAETERRLVMEKDDNAMSEFYTEALRTILHVFAKLPLPISGGFGPFFFQVALGLPWHYLTADQYASVLIEISNMRIYHSNRVPWTKNDSGVASASAMMVETEEKRTLVLLRALGSLTFLGKRSCDLGSSTVVKGLEKERNFLTFMRSLLDFLSSGVTPAGRARNMSSASLDISITTDQDGMKKDHSPTKKARAKSMGGSSLAAHQQQSLSKLTNETSRLPFPPGSYVMLLFESFGRIRASLENTGMMNGLDSYASMKIMLSSLNEGAPFALDLLFGEMVQFLNLNGVSFGGFPLDQERVGSEGGGGGGGVSDMVFEKVESILRSFSSAWPSSFGTSTSAEVGDDGSSSTSSSARGGNGTKLSNQNLTQSWSSWGEMWKILLPVMIAATQKHPPFDNFPEIPLETMMGKKNPRRRSESVSEESCATDYDMSLDSFNVSGEGGHGKLLVTGSGYGALLYCFIKATPSSIPLMIYSCGEYIKNQSRMVEILEACIHSWLMQSTNLQPLVMALSQVKELSVDNYSELRHKAMQRGAWLTLYLLFLVALTTDSLSVEEAITQVASAVNICGQVYHTSSTNNNIASYIRPRQYYIMPTVALFFDLCLNHSPSMPDAIKAEHLRTVVNGISAIQADRSGSLMSYASSIFKSFTSVISTTRQTTTTTGNNNNNNDNNNSDNATDTTNGNVDGTTVTGQSQAGNKEEWRFKILAKAVLLFIFVNSKKSTGLMRQSSAIPLNTGSKKANNMLHQLAQFEDSASAWAQGFCLAKLNSLKDYDRLMGQLYEKLYPEVKWLHRPEREWVLPESTSL